MSKSKHSITYKNHVSEVIEAEFIECFDQYPAVQQRSNSVVIKKAAVSTLRITGTVFYYTGITIYHTLRIALLVFVHTVSGVLKIIDAVTPSTPKGVTMTTNTKDRYYYRTRDQVEQYRPPADAEVVFMDHELRRTFHEKYAPKDPRDHRRTRWD